MLFMLADDGLVDTESSRIASSPNGSSGTPKKGKKAQ